MDLKSQDDPSVQGNVQTLIVSELILIPFLKIKPSTQKYPIPSGKAYSRTFCGSIIKKGVSKGRFGSFYSCRLEVKITNRFQCGS